MQALYFCSSCLNNQTYTRGWCGGTDGWLTQKRNVYGNLSFAAVSIVIILMHLLCTICKWQNLFSTILNCTLKKTLLLMLGLLTFGKFILLYLSSCLYCSDLPLNRFFQKSAVLLGQYVIHYALEEETNIGGILKMLVHVLSPSLPISSWTIESFYLFWSSSHKSAK